MACSTPPTYWPTGIHVAASATSKGSAASGKPQKRKEVPARIEERLERVVSRSAGPPRAGQVVLEERGVRRERGAPRGVHRHVVGRQHWQGLARHGHRPACGAVDDWDGTAPEALARDEPVAQAVVHLGRAAGLALEERRWRPRWPRGPPGADRGKSELILVPAPTTRRRRLPRSPRGALRSEGRPGRTVSRSRSRGRPRRART